MSFNSKGQLFSAWLFGYFLVTGFSVNFPPLTVVKLNKILTDRRGLG
jgi:hypothetical protein